jgi:hypothetical protein
VLSITLMYHFSVGSCKLQYVNKKDGRKEQNKNYFRKTVREIELNKSLENTFKASSMVGVLHCAG